MSFGTNGFIITISFCVLLSAGCAGSSGPDHSSMRHEMDHQVMPFDLNKTLHVFEMTESGGIQAVTVKNPGDKREINLIQEHLQREADRFSAGDYSDSASLHGANMPGIKELTAGRAKIKIVYAALLDGAQIIFTTDDWRLITAIHRWFGAQLSDHGPDATYR